MFSPQFSQHWTADQEAAPESSVAPARDDETLSQTQKQALEELAERISAARSIL
ncbi:MAG: hypothetical protein M3Z31_13630 [Pseudomonadota bacterium]|nr:hypothetical protein [Pseudomonadota bacterium]